MSALAQLLRQARSEQWRDIDGSYCVTSQIPDLDVGPISHPAYTLNQVEAEKSARRQGHAQVYFVRDESKAAPYWISPKRFRNERVTLKHEGGDTSSRVLPFVIYTVAKSREDRHNGYEVRIPFAVLAIKDPAGQAMFTLSQIREAVAKVAA